MSETRKKIKNLTKFIKRNKEFISIILVSKDFMVKLKNESDLINIDIKTVSDGDDEREIWFLNGCPIVFNSALTEGCIIEDSSGEHIIFSNF
jgi:hypothetical protein